MNRIGTEGAMALASAIQQWHSLQTLYIGNNSIGEEGIMAIAPAIQQCQSLTTLDIGII